MEPPTTFEIEDKHTPPFFKKLPLSIDRGEGIWVWDESGKKYIDFTSGWGVTSLGHAHPAIIDAIGAQSRKIIQNPSSGLTYSPARARLLSILTTVLPRNLTRVFFSNSGAEANDAAIKLARKITGRMDVISTHLSFHGRTISTASATGQAKHREKFNPLMPNYRFVPFNDLDAMAAALDPAVAAVILEPIQGEGGVRISSTDYLPEVSALCKSNGSMLIVDEIQTGFCRTGPMFATGPMDIEVDFLTMAKGIAGGFPLGAFAMTEAAAQQVEIGDHGGTYCGNPLACAVASAVIGFMLDNDIESHVTAMGALVLERMRQWQSQYPAAIRQARGQGLLTAMEFKEEARTASVYRHCLEKGLLVNMTQGNIIRIFPALTVTPEELEQGLAVLDEVLASR